MSYLSALRTSFRPDKLKSLSKPKFVISPSFQLTKPSLLPKLRFTNNQNYRQILTFSILSFPKTNLFGKYQQCRTMSHFSGRWKNTRSKSFGQKIDDADPNTLVYALVGINALVFFACNFALLEKDPRKKAQINNWIRENLSLSNYNLKNGRYWTIITNGFTHTDPFHFLFNCVTLYYFAQAAAITLGNRRFLGLYLFSGLLSSAAHCAFQATFNKTPITSKYTSGDVAFSLGASGHTMGLLSYFALKFPFEKIYFFFVPVPAAILVGGFLAYDLFSIGGKDKKFGVKINHISHLGGAIAGGLVFLATRRPPPSVFRNNPTWRR